MKKVFQILSIPLCIIFIGFLIYGLTLGHKVTGDNYSKELMNKYKTKEVRLKYYEDNKDSFNTIANLFDKYEDIQSIIKNDNNTICPNKEYKIELNKDLSICSRTKIKDINKEELITSINNLKEIIKIEKNNVINENNKEVEASVKFYLITSLKHNIYYEICLCNVECNTVEDYYENSDKKIYQKNRIDDKWNSTYDDIASN